MNLFEVSCRCGKVWGVASSDDLGDLFAGETRCTRCGRPADPERVKTSVDIDRLLSERQRMAASNPRAVAVLATLAWIVLPVGSAYFFAKGFAEAVWYWLIRGAWDLILAVGEMGLDFVQDVWRLPLRSMQKSYELTMGLRHGLRGDVTWLEEMRSKVPRSRVPCFDLEAELSKMPVLVAHLQGCDRFAAAEDPGCTCAQILAARPVPSGPPGERGDTHAEKDVGGGDPPARA